MAPRQAAAVLSSNGYASIQLSTASRALGLSRFNGQVAKPPA